MAEDRQSAKRRILFREDIEFSGVRLKEILQDQNYELIACDCQASLGIVASDLESRPDLVILSLGCADSSMMEEIRELRAPPRNRQIPILGVATFTNLGLDLTMLRAHGVVGLIDENSEVESVIRRVDLILESRGHAELCERVPCFFPVEVEGDDGSKREYALNLSASGIRLTSTKPIDPNRDLELRFRLPMISGNLISVKGRVMRTLPIQNSAGRYEIGVFFYPMSSFSRNLIAKEVERLLAD